MCGIAGIVGVSEDSAGTERLLAMREAMAHRGPDGSGLWQDPARRVGLAHRRLAIIDLTPAGAQPMGSADGRVQLVFNGEIYNHLELRAELERAGYRFSSRSDTEVLLHGYLEWGGPGLLDRLVGMFAFGIWDDGRQTLFLARDRIGIKPLYFWQGSGEFLFASEAKALLADRAVPREACPVAAWHYLSFLVPPAPMTTFRGIYKLPAGCFMEVRPGASPALRRWWDPADDAPPDVDPSIYGDEDECAREVIRRLDRSIERRMMSDVPFGVFLSGGIDSTANVALMARHMDRPVDTFSVGFKDHEAYNELDYARLAAERFGARHHEVVIDERDMQTYLPELVRQQDEPIADWVCVPLYYVSDLAKRSGVTVVQVGEGADELFCGYEHFRVPLDRHRRYEQPLGLLPRPLRRGVVGAAKLAGRLHAPWARRAEIAEKVAGGEEIFWGGAICFRGAIKNEVWNGPSRVSSTFPDFLPRGYGSFDSHAVVRELMDRFRRENPRADYYQGMLFLELRQRLPELLLMRVDKITMSTSVEARVPFLDQDLVAFSMKLPLHMRLRGRTGKYLLKKALRGLLPDEIIDRPKMGFGAPVREWLTGPFGDYARDRLLGSSTGLLDLSVVRRLLDEHVERRANWSFHLWVLLNYVMWHDHWIRDRPRP
jgi:asparagine synthase (glutamine-hydrolysing)